jgi:hypothetical protein
MHSTCHVAGSVMLMFARKTLREALFVRSFGGGNVTVSTSTVVRLNGSPDYK